MSLFSGITFSDKARSIAAPANGTEPSDPAASASTPATPTTAAAASGSKESSAALKFAPRIKSTTAKAPRTSYTGNATVYSSQPSTPAQVKARVEGQDDGTVGVNDGQGKDGEEARGKANDKGKEKEQVVLGPDGKALARAPAMTIAAAEKGKRDRNDGQKKRQRKKRRYFVSHNFDPEEEYDPNRPNDLGEYQAFRRRIREERNAERARRREEEESGAESSYHSDSSEDAPRRDAPKLFAPPKQYSPPPARVPPSAPPPTLPSMSGDDAYARRAAMAHTGPVVSGDDAYARRLAMSQAQIQPTAYIPREESGDDAYARRAAMSNSQPPPLPGEDKPPPPTDDYPPRPMGFVPPPAHLLAAAPKSTPPTHVSGAPGFQPPPAHLAANAPGVAAFRPPVGSGSSPGGPMASVGSGAQPGFAALLEEKKRAAEAIAAKFAALAGGGSRAPVVSEDDDQSGTFAEKMFRKWGHVEGTGLGVRGEGIIHALQAEHVTASVDTSKLSKRQLAKQKAAAANAKQRKWVQAPTARGRIVNLDKEERQREERERKGEEGRVVCLLRVVESVDEVDEEIAEDIGTECSNYGIVERVVLHMVEPPPEDPAECLRVFVVFSGMAGAWRAVKELDGRFFGGRKIVARYFDEKRFDAGDRDGEM